MLAHGSKGIDVEELQQNLKVLGFDPGPIDGIFGKKTEVAVIAFQRAHGLAIDGIAGPETQAHIRKLINSRKQESGGVAELQRLLIQLGFNPGPVDSILGTRTATAVMSFQERYGLYPDGIPGSKTWKKLREVTEVSELKSVPLDYDWPLKHMADLESVDYLVVHHTSDPDMSAAQINTSHRDYKGWAGIGYHKVIRQDGTLEDGRPESKAGAHCIPLNRKSLGVVLTGNLSEHPPTESQTITLIKLLKHWQKKYPGAKVVRHKDYSATDCPGDKFPWDELQERLGKKKVSDYTYTKERHFNSDVHVLKIRNPKVGIVQANNLARTSDLTKGARFAINGGYFVPYQGKQVVATPVVLNSKSIGSEINQPARRAVFCCRENGSMERRALNVWELIAAGYAQALGGGPTLVENGEVRVMDEKFLPDIMRGRAPRTAVGLVDEHTLLLIVAEGRNWGDRGLTLQELASVMISHGCRSAMNLDGGGSSTMVVNGKVMNYCSDGKERSVKNALVVY